MRAWWLGHSLPEQTISTAQNWAILAVRIDKFVSATCGCATWTCADERVEGAHWFGGAAASRAPMTVPGRPTDRLVVSTTPVENELHECALAKVLYLSKSTTNPTTCRFDWCQARSIYSGWVDLEPSWYRVGLQSSNADCDQNYISRVAAPPMEKVSKR